jgi:hypothetical protein
MMTIYQDGRWSVVLRVVNALSAAGFVTKTDTKGHNGVFTVAVPMIEHVAAKRIIAELSIVR